jgi:hypothetical protein
MYGFRLTFVVFMDGDLPNSFSAASFIGEQTIIILFFERRVPVHGYK